MCTNEGRLNNKHLPVAHVTVQQHHKLLLWKLPNVSCSCFNGRVTALNPTPLRTIIPPFTTARVSSTFNEGRGLHGVRHAELALLPAAVVADQGVVGLLDVHVVADAEHVTGSLDHGREQDRSNQEGQRGLTSGKRPFSFNSYHSGCTKF